MTPFRAPYVMTWAVIVLAVGCREPTSVDTAPAAVTWIEWPTAVSAAQPGSIRISGFTQCPYSVAFGAYVSNWGLHVTAEGRNPSDLPCEQAGLDGGGAGFDTVLSLPELPSPPGGLPFNFAVYAPVAHLSGYLDLGQATERYVGQLWLQSQPDTATQFAGTMHVVMDTLGCWRGVPASAPPRPGWAFAKPVPLVSQPGPMLPRLAYVRGHFVSGSPAGCGDDRAMEVSELDVDATPYPATGHARQDR